MPKGYRRLNAKLTAEICKLVRAGNYRETACAAVGVESRLLREWLRKGAVARAENRDDEYRRFADAMDEAEAKAEARDVALIGKHALQDWRAAADRLSKRHPKRWGAQVRIKVEAELENFLSVAERVLDEEAFGRLLEALAAQDGEKTPD